MGLFDTILIQVTCPKCGTKDKDVQTKALDSSMQTFSVGDALPQERAWIKEGWIMGTGYCENCQATYDVRVFISNGTISGQWEHVTGTT